MKANTLYLCDLGCSLKASSTAIAHKLGPQLCGERERGSERELERVREREKGRRGTREGKEEGEGKGDPDTQLPDALLCSYCE